MCAVNIFEPPHNYEPPTFDFGAVDYGEPLQPSWPCATGHDYAVGATHAICNRCERVIELGVAE